VARTGGIQRLPLSTRRLWVTRCLTHLSIIWDQDQNDIFRMKGVFAIAGEDRRLALQGVHMLLKAERLDSWGARSRRSTLVFIGRNLDREALKAGIEECISRE